MNNLAELIIKVKKSIENSKNIEDLELIRVKYFGKKGYFLKQIQNIKNISHKKRYLIGFIINRAKKNIQKEFLKRKEILKKISLILKIKNETLDISLPGRRIKNGNFHPISIIIEKIEYFFAELGFSVISGPEIENDYYNFDALNIPKNHPTRNDHDTFWLDSNRLLRTQTSGMQIRTMKYQKPPIRIIAPGKVYRNDYDQTHTPMFHQIEGLIVDKNINFTNIKNIIYNFLFNFFKKKLNIRFRPSYFPFTEPSAEVDIMEVNKNWLEVLGCGMVHPNILINVNIDPDIYSGFAFGMGIERLTMLYYNIKDLRTFFKNDLYFLKKFI